jgi:hypothetical protein
MGRQALFFIAVLAAGKAACAAEPAATPEAPPLRSQFVFEARITVDKPLVVGQGPYGLRRVVPISGGSFSGPAIKGTVLPGGADWQFVRPDGVIDIHARYTLKADDGVLISVENRGLRHASPAVMERIAKGEFVPGSEYYFRTTASFEAPAGSRHEWLNRAVFIGVAERRPDAAVLRFYRVD